MDLATNSSDLNSKIPIQTNHQLSIAYFAWTYYVDSVMSYSSPIIVLIGILTNIINIIVFQAQGLKDGVTISLFTLSLSDFTLCVMLLGASITGTIKILDPTNVLDPDSIMVACFGYSRSAAYCYSTCVTICISLERSLCVILPFKFKTMFTKRVTTSILLCLAICVAALFAPVFATQGLAWRFDPRYNATRLLLWRAPNIRDIQVAYAVTTTLMIPIASQVIIGVSTVLMIYGLRASRRFKDVSGARSIASKNDSVQTKELKAVKMVLYLSVIFFVCNLPLVLTGLAQIILPEFQIKRRLSMLYATVYGFVLLVSAVNGSVNFFVYYFHSSRFKEVLQKLLNMKHPSPSS